ncbi:hypothetical protein GJ633_01320 [Halorubrum sp. CBA1125]|uniref:hypothetical protein n=1 Tax=Halorubrum sp. CBA1125 TaxID=2668072 RepID=UPI0012E83527|nr:hypothetical protein [Halorubrum sp. CBA1125]MUW13441.1 hypothetical protein [Halorubrum sp. CBA1125]
MYIGFVQQGVVFIFEVRALLDQPLPAVHECAALSEFFGRDATLSDHAGSAKLFAQLRVESVVFHLSLADRLSLGWICGNHVEVFVEDVVDRVVVAGYFERRFGSGILFDNLGIVVQSSDVTSHLYEG